MRKKLIMALLVVLICTVAGCGNKNKDDAEGDEESGAVKITDVQAAAVPGMDNPGENSDEAEPVEEVEEVEDTPVFFTSADLLWVLPKSFRALDGAEGVYVPRDHQRDTSTVIYVIAESDENISDVSQDEFREMMEADFLDTYGDQVSISITNFEKIKVNKRSGLRIDMEYEFKGTEYRQTEIMLYNGDESHIITYTQEKDGKWAEEFENSISSLNFAD